MTRVMELPQWLFRVGFGFDAHAFSAEEDREDSVIYLCGLPIQYPHQIVAHSDGDVALHAVADALFGSMAMENIGYHFPIQKTPEGMQSKVMIEKALRYIRDANCMLVNVDIAIVCEEPKISKYLPSLKKSLSEILQLPLDSVNVKGVTTEKLGFTGRKEGIAAYASCSVMVPNIVI